MTKQDILILLFAFAFNICAAQSIVPSTKPNPAQQAMIDRGYGMFIHFGINTFNDVEWSDGTLPVSSYNPTNLDPEQWVRTAKDAGFRYVLLVAKHHDGFCLWDSKFTTYDVASSPVKTDVVKAVAEACQKYDVQFAIYYSLWDRNEPSYQDQDPQAYINYMLNQLTELYTNYGVIAELWLDGGWDKNPSDWGIDQIYSLVKRFNPACAVSVNHTIVNEEGKRDYTIPSEMTVNDKYFFQYFPSDFRLWDPKMISKFDQKQYIHQGESYYLPFEHTICISKNWNWFEKSQPLPTRDLDELEELFYWSTENNNCMVINVSPDQTGRIREYVANTAIALGKRLHLAPHMPLPRNGKFISLEKHTTTTSVWPDHHDNYASSAINDGKLDSRWAAKDLTASVEIKLDPNEAFNKITIFEYQDTQNLPDGFSQVRVPRIKKYSIAIWQQNEWQTIYLSDVPMGDCKVIKFPARYQTEKLRFNVHEATAPPSIYELSVINIPEADAI